VDFQCRARPLDGRVLRTARKISETCFKKNDWKAPVNNDSTSNCFERNRVFNKFKAFSVCGRGYQFQCTNYSCKFLTLNLKSGIPNTEISNDSDYKPYTDNKLIEDWKKGQKMLDTFWNIWKKEYILSLRERTQTKLKSGHVSSQFKPNVKDVALLKEDSPRGHWKLGRISKLLKSDDGEIRAAKVVVSTKLFVSARDVK
jgi:hypothetical protein